MKNILVAAAAAALSFSVAATPVQQDKDINSYLTLDDFPLVTEQAAYCVGLTASVTQLADAAGEEGVAFVAAVTTIGLVEFLPTDENDKVLKNDGIEAAVKAGKDLYVDAIFGKNDEMVGLAGSEFIKCIELNQKMHDELNGGEVIDPSSAFNFDPREIYVTFS